MIVGNAIVLSGGGAAVLEPITITENGIYLPPSGVDGYSMIIAGVAVRAPRCDQTATFDWATQQTYMAWQDGTPAPAPPTPPEPPTPPTPPTPPVVSFETGTDEQIAAILDAASQGGFDLQQDAGWRVGDRRLIHIDAWTGGNGEAHVAEDLHIVITSFDEYMGCGNVMQFDFSNCCRNAARMNATNTTSGGYGATEMYTATLPALVEALPSWLRTRLKTFSVLASAAYPNAGTIETLTGNKLALRSSVEIFGASEGSLSGEGTQLAYYTTRANRRKCLMPESASGYVGWNTRSPRGELGFFEVTPEGYLEWNNASQPLYLAPFGCL